MRIPALLIAISLAAGCTTETMPVAVTDPGPAAAVATPVSAQDTGLGGLINNYRAAQGKSPLAQNAALTRAANAHAQDMVAQGYFSHTGRDGSSVGSRARAAGCSWSGVAENIAQGQTSPDEAMTTWINSAGHRANILGPYTQYGAARSGNTWVLVFASGC